MVATRDLAKLYGVETKRINEAVKNNLKKFPERFSWKLTDDEIETRGGRYKNPRFFTEQGIDLLVTILKSKIATEVSIAIINAFVTMLKYISNNIIEQKYINNMVLEHDSKIKLLQDSYSRLEEKNN